MSKSRLITLAAVVIGVAAVLWAVLGPRHDSPGQPVVAGGLETQGSAPHRAPSPGADIGRRRPVRMDDPVHAPQTEAERAWLNRHLYPSEIEPWDAAAAGPSAREDLLKGRPPLAYDERPGLDRMLGALVAEAERVRKPKMDRK